jgi:hypothetical protein
MGSLTELVSSRWVLLIDVEDFSARMRMRERVTALLEWCWDDQYGGRSATEQSYHRIAELDRDLERTTPQLSASSALNTDPHTRQGAAE